MSTAMKNVPVYAAWAQVLNNRLEKITNLGFSATISRMLLIFSS